MIWIRPTGTEIETNNSEDTIEYAKSMGWKEKKVKTRPKKVINSDDNSDTDNKRRG
jgi:hypothetical protein